jgi:hypothetical protein
MIQFNQNLASVVPNVTQINTINTHYTTTTQAKENITNKFVFLNAVYLIVNPAR